MRGGELLEWQRAIYLSKLDAREGPTQIAANLGCVRSYICKTRDQFLTTYDFKSRPQVGRPPILTRWDYRLLGYIVKKFNKIQFILLIKEAGLQDTSTNILIISKAILAQEIAKEELYYFRSKYRLKITKAIVRLRLKLINHLSNQQFERKLIYFSNKYSVTYSSSYSTTQVQYYPKEKQSYKNFNKVPYSK